VLLPSLVFVCLLLSSDSFLHGASLLRERQDRGNAYSFSFSAAAAGSEDKYGIDAVMHAEASPEGKGRRQSGQREKDASERRAPSLEGEEEEGEVTLINSHPNFAVDVAMLEKHVKVIKDALGVSAFDVGIELVSDEKMQSLNREYRGEDKTTDILSFPFLRQTEREARGLKKGEVPQAKGVGDLDLGDIFISLDRIQSDTDADRKAAEESMGGEFGGGSASFSPSSSSSSARDVLPPSTSASSSPSPPFPFDAPDGGQTGPESASASVSVPYVPLNTPLGRELLPPDVNERRGCYREMAGRYSVRRRLPYLCIHGLLHLLGFNDQTEAEWLEMTAREETAISDYLQRVRQGQALLKASRFHTFSSGVGTDIVEVDRVRQALVRHEDLFIKRILTLQERMHYERIKNECITKAQNRNSSRESPWVNPCAAFVAKRFATKESVSKAVGLGLRHVGQGGLRLTDIEVTNLPTGQPTVSLLGEAARTAASRGIVDLLVSHADERDYVVSFATALSVTR